jgi:hypothetical protein
VLCSFFSLPLTTLADYNYQKELIMLGMQELRKLKDAPSPIEPYLSQAQAAVAAARKSLGMSPREVILPPPKSWSYHYYYR